MPCLVAFVPVGEPLSGVWPEPKAVEILTRTWQGGGDPMAKKQQESKTRTHRTRYEYRVWGKHRKARKILARLAAETTEQEIDDCYLLGADPGWNAKVRGHTLKLKRLVSEDRGFEQWRSRWIRSADSAPTPFDDLFDELRLGRPAKGKSFNIERAVAALHPGSGVRPVFVTKHRTRYRIGNLLAEVTDIEIKGDTAESVKAPNERKVLRTLSIEGDDLEELVALRKQLGLKGEPNVAVHQAIEAAS